MDVRLDLDEIRFAWGTLGRPRVRPLHVMTNDTISRDQLFLLPVPFDVPKRPVVVVHSDTLTRLEALAKELALTLTVGELLAVYVEALAIEGVVKSPDTPVPWEHPTPSRPKKK